MRRAHAHACMMRAGGVCAQARLHALCTIPSAPCAPASLSPQRLRAWRAEVLALTPGRACNRSLPTEELARIAAALPSGNPDELLPLTPSHSLLGEQAAPMCSPPLPSDVSGLALNHMPHTPHSPAPASEPAEKGSMTMEVDYLPSDSQMRMEHGADAAVAQAQGRAPARWPPAQAAVGVARFLGAVHSIELTRLQTYGKMEEAQFPFDISCLSSLRVLRFGSEDMLAEGALSALLDGLDAASPPAAPAVAASRAPLSLVELDLSGQRLLTSSLLETVTARRSLAQLCVLRLRRTSLDKVPVSALKHVPHLSELDCSDNRLLEVPPQLVHILTRLEVLNLESNRLTVPSLDFRHCTSLRALLLGLNPLEYLPTLGPLTSLVLLSICALKVTKCGPRPAPEEALTAMPITAEFMPSGGQSWTNLLPWSKEGEQCVKSALALMFKSSASFHPLLASFMALLAKSDKYKDLFASDTVTVGNTKGSGLRHILAMCQAEPDVCLDALVALGNAMQGCEAKGYIDSKHCEIVIARVLEQIQEDRAPAAVRLYAIQVLRSMAANGDRMAEQVLLGPVPRAAEAAASSTAPGDADEKRRAQDRRYKAVVGTVRTLLLLQCPAATAATRPAGWSDEKREAQVWRAVKANALLLIGDLAFAAKCRGRLLRDGELLQHLQLLADGGDAAAASASAAMAVASAPLCPPSAAAPPAAAAQEAGGGPAGSDPGGSKGGDTDMAGEDVSAHMGDVSGSHVGGQVAGEAVGEEEQEAETDGLSDQMEDVHENAEGEQAKQHDDWYADMFAPYEKRWWGKFHVAGAARRALVILGEKGVLSNARQVPGARARGLRVLCIDGGGVKGIVALRLLAHLEHVLGRPLWQVFDLVAGTSAGGIIATSVSSRIPMLEAERLYDKVVVKAFSVMMQHSEDVSDAAIRDPATASWWQKLYQSGSSMKRFPCARTPAYLALD